ncbi:MAG TPA: hypothetical protein VGS27_22990 [Candidatus Sulfotelmatobacter sp.]|nr:hypothetical protein [Candidatus Sulfotelmatobacter sp.]
MAIGKAVLFLLVFSLPTWSSVYVHWSTSDVPPASSLGVNDIVFSLDGHISPLVTAARKRGYRVYVEVPLQQAKSAAEQGTKAGWTGIIVDTPENESREFDGLVAKLRSDYPKLRVLFLNRNGKQPGMRGSIVIKRGDVLEVSSPTAQPWIDTNLALVKVEQRSRQPQVPLFTSTWADQAQQKGATVDDYSLAVAEADAFHADLLLQVDEHLQQGLTKHDANAWALWSEVRPLLKFSPDAADAALQPAANVAVIVDNFDASDEVLNLLGRHNIPYQIFLPADLKTAELKGFNVAVVLAKPDGETAERLNRLAASGATVVVVDAHGSYPWQSSQSTRVNEHTTSYASGNGKVLEFSEPVTDPETFAQDVRRLVGKQNALLRLWNGLTTLAVPYQDRSGTMKLLEFVNYAGDPVRLQVQVKGSFASVRYETPEHGCCQSLEPVSHDGFTEFVVPDVRVTGRVHLEAK